MSNQEIGNKKNYEEMFFNKKLKSIGFISKLNYNVLNNLTLFIY